MYGTAQFKLDRTRMQHGLDTTRFSFHTNASMRVHACKPACVRKIDDINPTLHNSHVCTRRVHDARLQVRNAHAKFGLRVYANCKPTTAE